MREKVLITGGTGFLGRRLAAAMKDRYDVVLAARNNKQNMAAHHISGCEVIPLDITSIESVRDAIVAHKPDIVIHAAATKFVDLSEKEPHECIDVNVVGSQNVARVCMERGIGTVIGVSTDKASPPVRNTYALTKAVMERLFCSLDAKSDTRFVCVRFGNLAWSTGSVLPIWKQMHEEAGVIGTTGPDMRRFFIHVDEAVRLIQTAIDHRDTLRGRVLTHQMKAVLIRDLLELWIREKGGSWQRIEGRPGERDDEYLVGDLELPYTTRVEFDGITHYVVAFNERSPIQITESLSSATMERLSEAEMLAIINDVPPQNELS